MVRGYVSDCRDGGNRLTRFREYEFRCEGCGDVVSCAGYNDDLFCEWCRDGMKGSSELIEWMESLIEYDAGLWLRYQRQLILVCGYVLGALSGARQWRVQH